jgi:hypothetical protein
MNENSFFASDLRGFSRITRRQTDCDFAMGRTGLGRARLRAVPRNPIKMQALASEGIDFREIHDRDCNHMRPLVRGVEFFAKCILESAGPETIPAL